MGTSFQGISSSPLLNYMVSLLISGAEEGLKENIANYGE